MIKKTVPALFFLLVVSVSCSVTNPIPDKSGVIESMYSTTDGSKFASVGSSGGSSGGTGDSTVQHQPGIITAGEWNDNFHWDFWMNLMANQEYADDLSPWQMNPTVRLPFQIKDSFNRSLIDAAIEIRNAGGLVLWKCKTDNFGKAVAWPGLFNSSEVPTDLIITYANKSFIFKNYSFKPIGNNINLSVVRDQLIDADIAFVVDATGSMGDELEYLKVELNDVLARASENNCSNWRLGSVFYRDAGDEYVTRVSPFTSNASTIIDFVKSQSADGGGDWPEAVHSALNESLNNLDWSDRARARLLFLVLDAPPHQTADVIESLKEHIRTAAEKGIKIIPIVASGIDKQTEFLMRTWSLATNGTYIFITNDSGIGNDHLIPTVGNYTVEKLNDLMVRLIYQYTSCTSE